LNESDTGIIVKKKLGYKCQVCGFEFDKHYGNIGLGYIEAHHLKPISELKDTRIPMNPIKDFAVLCANCHRMIHRTKNVGDIQRFKTEFISKKNN
jgi:5-methylcytosine-specific restriction protein A